MVLLWDALATTKTGVLSASFGEETRLAPGTAWLSYVRCHDDIGLGFDEEKILRAGFSPAAHRRFLLDFYSGRFPGSFARGRLFMENPATGDARICGTCASLCGLEAALEAADPVATELALRRIELLYGPISSLVGIPLVFSGDELGLRNDRSWEDDPHLGEDNRWMHRPRLDWSLAERRNAAGSVEGRIFSWIAGCLRLRRGIEAFAQDAPFEVLPPPDPHVFLCLRRPRAGSPGREVLVMANFAPEERCLARDALPAGFGAGARLLLRNPAPPTEGASGETGSGGETRLAAYELRWLERDY
jgi:amylosucrase